MRDPTYGGNDVLRAGVIQEISADTCSHGLQETLRVISHAKENDLQLWSAGERFRNQVWRSNRCRDMVDEQDVTLPLGNLPLCVHGIAIHAGHGKIRLLLEDGCERFAKQAILDEQKNARGTCRARFARVFHMEKKRIIGFRTTKFSCG